MLYSGQIASNNFDATLLDRWLKLLKHIGAKGDEQYHKYLYRCLTHYYNAPGRYYHNLEHIKQCLSKFDEIRHLLQGPDDVELAIWFHDAIYEFWARQGQNEYFSAELARLFIRCWMGISWGLDIYVVSLIGNTKYFGINSIDKFTDDSAYFRDIDLCSGLGGIPSDFKRKSQLVAEEYGWVDSKVFLTQRLEILQMFWSWSPFYLTGYFRDRHEEQTKINLEVGIREVERRLLSSKALPQ